MLMLVRARPVFAAAKGISSDSLAETTEIQYALPKDVTANAVFDMNGSGVGICVDFIPTKDGFMLENCPNKLHNVVALCQGIGPVVGCEWGISTDSRFDLILQHLAIMHRSLDARCK